MHNNISLNYYPFEEVNEVKIKCRNSLLLWSSKSDKGLGYYDFIKTKNKTSAPPEWFVDDLWGAWGSALFTDCPFTALAGGAVSSAISAFRKKYE